MTISTEICPGCDRGKLTPVVYSDEFKHGDTTITVDGLEGYVCDTCPAEPIYPDQIIRGQRKIADARRKHDGLLTGGEIKTIRKKLNLTQREAAKVFGGGANAFSKYERGDVMQSEPMDKLLRLAAHSSQVVQQLREQKQHRRHP